MIDHIVVVTDNLFRDAQWLSDRTGISGEYGGRNPLNSTHNVLFPLVGKAYLELLAADDDGRGTAERELPFGLGELPGPSVAGWAARVPDFDATVARARADGVPLGEVVQMSRTRPDGVKLLWKMTYPLDTGSARLCPFLIDWGMSQPPGAGFESGVDRLVLTVFETMSTMPQEVCSWLKVLGLYNEVRVIESETCGFRLTLSGRAGSASLGAGPK